MIGTSQVASNVVTIPRTDPSKGTVRFHLDAARYLLEPDPYAVAKYRSPAYEGVCPIRVSW